MGDDSRTMTAALEAPKPPPTRYVEVRAAQGRPAVYRAHEGVVRVGRDAGNEVVIDDPFISRVHLEVRVFPHGVELVDLETKNGTHFQGARIRELPLKPDAEVELLLGKQCRIHVRLGDDGPRAERPAMARPSRDTSALVGDSQAMQRLRTLVGRVASSELTVLIEGETGTGKEVVARAIHAASRRAAQPLVVFDCAAVSPALLASELFGHVKGAFTGAVGSKEGAFRTADKGTLFFDEIGELPLELQPALLRVLEARQVRPVGATEYRSADVRVIAATNRDLEAEVAAGRFRQDLLFRLAVGRVKVPPLRARADDVAGLARYFASLLNATLSDAVCDALALRPWPGNVRELRNVVERAVMLADSAHVATLEDALDEAAPRGTLTYEAPAGLAPAVGADPLKLPFQDAKQQAVDAFERDYLLKLFEAAEYNLSEAARRSGVDRRYLRDLFKKHNIDLDAMRARRG
ncbi:MAG: sigma 54-interacting transcriptional regulator [Myxococcales bacterium]|nr:sigma 54-interacting transcriptional regulator [Myxococcales bacterium]